MSGSPFASSGVTAADIQDIQKRLNEIEKKIVDGFTGVSNKILSITAATSAAPTAAPTPSVSPSALDSVLPAPTQSRVDLSSIFPKEGGGRKRTKRLKRHVKGRKNKV
jgi:hypothetical protein